ncbi:hypothetical protein EVA_21404, partial [gut metagenome]
KMMYYCIENWDWEMPTTLYFMVKVPYLKKKNATVSDWKT